MKNISASVVLIAIALGGCAARNPPAQATAPEAPPTVHTPGPQASSDEIAHQLFDALNQQRSANGLQPYTNSPELTRSAQAHTDKMVSGTFISTRGADEADPVTRITSQGVKTLKLGEDVGRIKTRPDHVADDTMAIWMAAPSNRKNILSSTFTKTGIAVAQAPDGDYYISADFAQ